MAVLHVHKAVASNLWQGRIPAPHYATWMFARARVQGAKPPTKNVNAALFSCRFLLEDLQSLPAQLVQDRSEDLKQMALRDISRDASYRLQRHREKKNPAKMCLDRISPHRRFCHVLVDTPV
jgi:hypothetical protein